MIKLQPDTELQLETALKQALQSLPTGTLPLEKGTSRGGFVDDGDISVTVIELHRFERNIDARIGVFFTEIIGGCGCGDDPTPENAYCEMRVHINSTTFDAEFEIIDGE